MSSTKLSVQIVGNGNTLLFGVGGEVGGINISFVCSDEAFMQMLIKLCVESEKHKFSALHRISIAPLDNFRSNQ